MKTDYKVGDKVTILPFEVGTVGNRVYHQEMLQNIGLEGTVVDAFGSGVHVKTSVDAWSYDFKFISPVNAEVSTESTKSNVEVTMKNVTINVINQSKKVQRKLSAKLEELGYPLDQDWDSSDETSSTRIYQEYMNHDLHVTSCRPSAIVVDAEGKKFKVVLAEVCSHLGLNTPALSTEVNRDTPDVPTEEPKPEVKPQSIKDGNFPVTRVRVKESGAEGVVIGRGRSGTSIAVLHDEPEGSLHNGNDYVKGADKRTWFYPEHNLEVI